jgi:hypothetical protein
MGRIRTIKPEFPQSESMGRVSRDARLLFIMLWTIVDDDGKARAAPRMLASLLYPYDDDAKTHITEWLFELERQSCIRLYEVDGNAYLQIEKWLEHQKIDRPSKSRLPSPSADRREESRAIVKPSATDLVPRTVDQGLGKVLPVGTGLKKSRDAYPEDFEAFWKAYPTDKNMPKKPALRQWQRLSPEKRSAAIAAIPGFRRYCDENKSWYRPVYAERFLSQEKFEGYAAETPPMVLEEGEAKAAWGGRAGPLVEQIGVAKFSAWFATATFEHGDPVKITFQREFQRNWAKTHFVPALAKAFGHFELGVAA